MSGSYHQLGELSYAKLEALLTLPERSVAIIPTGSVEAHGPHLPLNTDTLISTEVAGRAAMELADRGLVAICFPPISYGVTDWAADFKGTVSISVEATESTVLAACDAAHSFGFDRVVVTNAHLEPGHIQTLRGVAKQFEARTGQPLLFVDKTRRAEAKRLTPEFQSGSCHAGQYETSLVLAIRPDLVDRDAASELPEVVVALHEKIAAGAQGFADCGLTQAYCGNPSAATAEEGERTLDTLTEMVVEAVQKSFG